MDSTESDESSPAKPTRKRVRLDSPAPCGESAANATQSTSSSSLSAPNATLLVVSPTELSGSAAEPTPPKLTSRKTLKTTARKAIPRGHDDAESTDSDSDSDDGGEDRWPVKKIHDFSMFRHPGEEGHTLAWLVEWENFSLARSSWIVDEELECDDMKAPFRKLIEEEIRTGLRHPPVRLNITMDMYQKSLVELDLFPAGGTHALQIRQRYMNRIANMNSGAAHCQPRGYIDIPQSKRVLVRHPPRDAGQPSVAGARQSSIARATPMRHTNTSEQQQQRRVNKKTDVVNTEVQARIVRPTARNSSVQVKLENGDESATAKALVSVEEEDDDDDIIIIEPSAI